MRTYTTKQGDMWDSIAHTQLGNVAFADKIMNANESLLHYYIFPAGVKVLLPAVDTKDLPKQTPPWKRVRG